MFSKIKSQSLYAIVLTCFGYGCFTLTDTINKFLLDSYHLLFVIFGWSLASLLIVGSYGFFKYGLQGFKTEHGFWHLARALSAIFTTVMNAMGLKTLQLDEFYAIIFTTPCLLAIAAFLFLKEPLSKKQAIGILLGFICVLYMVRPGQDLFQIGALFIAIGTFFYTINCLIMRVLKNKDSVFLLTFLSSLALFIFSFIAIIVLPDVSFPKHVPPKDIVMFISFGIIASLGMIGTTIGMQKAPTLAVVAPFHYTQMIWGIIAGYLVFGDLPSQVTLIGATGLIVTGIYVLTHETKTCMKARAKNLAIKPKA